MMRTSLVAAAALACFGLLSACNDASMTGDSGKQVHAESKPVPALPETPAKPTPPSTPTTTPTTPPTTTPPTTTPPPVTPPPKPPTTPITDVGTGSGTGSTPGLGTSIFDIIGGLIKTLTDVQIDQPNQNEVIFGGNKTFHIGDGEFNASSECASEIHAYNLKGTRYFFQFEVLADDTTVDVSIGKICGVDYNESNSIFLQSGATNLDQKPLAKGQASAAFSTQKLAKGSYTILVESRAVGAEMPQQPNDHDDYIVGLVKVKGDKPIKPGKVGARP